MSNDVVVDDLAQEIYAEAISAVFGSAVDPREMVEVISKMGPDMADVHVPGSGQKRKKLHPIRAGHIVTADEERKYKRQAQVGLASNVLGLAAGGAALATAVKNPALRKPDVKNAGPVTGKIAEKTGQVIRHGKKGRKLLTPTGQKLVIAGAAGAVGLQAVNTAGDIVANRVLNREAKKEVKASVGKVLDARRSGLITSDMAVDMVAKYFPGQEAIIYGNMARMFAFGRAAKPARSVMGRWSKEGYKKVRYARQNRQASKNAQAESQKWFKDEMPSIKRDTLLAVGGGSATAGTAGGVAGKNYFDKKKLEPVGKSITWTGEISKVDSEKRQVFGWCSITAIDGEPVVDRQGDYIPLDEIEKAAYTYVVESRKGGDMHARDGENPMHVSNLVESFVVTPEKLQRMGLPDNALPHGWWVGFKVEDDKTWNLVKNGSRTGFSIHGSGKRVEKSL